MNGRELARCGKTRTEHALFAAAWVDADRTKRLERREGRMERDITKVIVRGVLRRKKEFARGSPMGDRATGCLKPYCAEEPKALVGKRVLRVVLDPFLSPR